MKNTSVIQIGVGSLIGIGDSAGEVTALSGDHLLVTMHDGTTRLYTFEDINALVSHKLLFIYREPSLLPSLRFVVREIPKVSKRQLKQALKIKLQLQPFLEKGEPPPKTLPTLRKHYNAYIELERRTGDGFLALVPREDLRGNRGPRCHPETESLIKQAIDERLKQPGSPTPKEVYGDYADRCKAVGADAVSKPTFKKFMNRLVSKHEVEETQAGPKAGYSSQPLPQETKTFGPSRKGQRPLEVAQVDHMLLPFYCLCPFTFVFLGNPWLTALVDTCTDRVLAQWIHFAEPSRLAIAMVLRICMKRFGRLPNYVSADWGPEHGSIFMETVLARYHCSKIENRKSSGRDNSHVERSFGRFTTEWLKGLRGYIPKDEDPRRRGKGFRPEDLATWPIDRFVSHADHYSYELHDLATHSLIGIPRRTHHNQLIQLYGDRPHVRYAYTEQLCIDFLPALDRPLTVNPQVGLRTLGMRYWNDAFLDPRTHGLKLAAKPDPFDASTVYAHLDSRWITCRSALSQVMGYWTTAEWAVVYEVLRKRKNLADVASERDAQAAVRYRQEMLREEEAFLKHKRQVADAHLAQQVAPMPAPEAYVIPAVQPTPEKRYEAKPCEVIK